jgi:hypothetical protein
MENYIPNPINLDYDILGYHKEKIFDSKGDLTTVNYYKVYDGTTYSDLEIKETRVYTRDATTKLATKRDMTIEWFEDDEVTVAFTKITEKYYTPKEGWGVNKRSRQNLLDTASMYLLGQVGLDDSKAFWKTLNQTVVEDYKEIGDLTLVTEINSSTETYMTPTIKGTLDTILNVTY